MCGVIGATGHLAPSTRLAPIAHRGPDADGSEHVTLGDTPMWLGHTRLAINDLSDDGVQPMSSRCSQTWLLFNGEIYNSPKLRRELVARGHQFRSNMDGEVILHIYEDEGIEGLARLNGIYAIAVVDVRAQTVWLARDPLGVKPLFLTTDGGQLGFASEPAAAASLLPSAPRPSTAAAAAFLTYLWVPHPLSPFESVEALAPRQIASWSPGRGLTRRRHPAAIELPEQLARPSRQAVASATSDLLAAAVDRQRLSDVPVGIMASGGVDSSLLWAFAREHVATAFTIDVQGGDEGLDEDHHAAVRLAAELGTPVVTVQKLDELRISGNSGDLFADPARSLVEAISTAARGSGIKVLLSGQGADELLGGYRRHTAARLLGLLDATPGSSALASLLPRPRGGRVNSEYVQRLLDSISSGDAFGSYMHLCEYSDARTRAEILGTYESEVDDDTVRTTHRRTWDEFPRNWPLLKRAMLLDLLVYMPGLGLAYNDRGSMAQGVEVRVPFLDAELVDHLVALDPAVLTGFRVRKRPAMDVAARMLPPYVWDRPKRGFGVPRELLPQTETTDRRSQYLEIARRELQRASLTSG